VEGNFGLRRFQLEGRVPRSSPAAAEASSGGMRVRKSGVDNVVEGKAGNQLNQAYAGQLAAFCQQAIIGRSLELREVAEQVIVVVRQAVQYRPAPNRLARHQAMSAVLRQLLCPGELH
jgi:hypothetical protein